MSEAHYVHHGDAVVDIGPHVFPIEKYALLSGWLCAKPEIDDRRVHRGEAIDEADLLRVHTPEFVADLLAARPTPALTMSELPVDAEVIQGFLGMSGGSVTSLRLALDHGLGFHLGGGFHHAFPDHAEGFCYVHDVAIAIERMRAERGLGSVLVVDVDLHQGNGTAVIYADDAATFTYSIHQGDIYPPKERSSLDRHLQAGVGDVDYLALLASDLDAVDRQITPDLVCFLAGVDPYRHDQLGGLDISAEGLARRDRLVLERYVGRGIPVAVFLAGGYARSPEETAKLHLATIEAAEDVCR